LTKPSLTHLALADLTLIIPSLDRAAFLRRQIAYWQQYPITILIVEGASVNTETDTKIGEARVIHIKSPLSVTQRLLLACERISTEYVAYCSDEDLYLPKGLMSSITRLKTEPHLVGCLGAAIRFSRRGSYLFAQTINSDNKDSSSVSRSASRRVLDNFRGMKISNQMFGVYRSHDWISVSRTCFQEMYSTAYVYEFLWSLLMLYRGEVGVHHDLTWLSSAENPSIMSGASFNRKLDVVEWMTESRYAYEVQKMQQLAVQSLTGLGVEPLEVVESTVSHYCLSFKGRYQHKRTWKYKWRPRQLSLRLLPLIPYQVKIFVKRRVSARFTRAFGLGIVPLQELHKELARRNVVRDEDEWNHFCEIVALPPL